MMGILIEKWSSIEEIAKHVGVGKDTIYRWIVHKQMLATKIGRRWKFKPSEVEEWARKDSSNS